MTNSQRLAAVRRRLEQWLDQHGKCVVPSEDSPSPVPSPIRKESILIRGGFYCGRQFDAGDYRAVWFIEEDQLKIYTAGGKWVCSLQGEELVSAVVDEVAADLTTAPASTTDAPERLPQVIPMISGRSTEPTSADATPVETTKVEPGVVDPTEVRRAA